MFVTTFDTKIIDLSIVEWFDLGFSHYIIRNPFFGSLEI